MRSQNQEKSSSRPLGGVEEERTFVLIVLGKEGVDLDQMEGLKREKEGEGRSGVKLGVKEKEQGYKNGVVVRRLLIE